MSHSEGHNDSPKPKDHDQREEHERVTRHDRKGGPGRQLNPHGPRPLHIVLFHSPPVLAAQDSDRNPTQDQQRSQNAVRRIKPDVERDPTIALLPRLRSVCHRRIVHRRPILRYGAVAARWRRRVEREREGHE